MNTAPTSASSSCSAISVGAAIGLISTAPRPSLAASAVRKAGHDGIRMAARFCDRARTSGAFRRSRVKPAATKACAGMPSTEPPPAAMARGRRVSESFTGGKLPVMTGFAICPTGPASAKFFS